MIMVQFFLVTDTAGNVYFFPHKYRIFESQLETGAVMLKKRGEKQKRRNDQGPIVQNLTKLLANVTLTRSTIDL